MGKEQEAYLGNVEQEVLAEMAQAFFGNRKGLEDMIEFFHGQVRELKAVCAEVKRRAAELNHLLLDGELAEGFYRAIGVAVEDLPCPVRDCARPELRAKQPFALTTRGRWLKLVQQAYAVLRQACHDYMHGRYYTDPMQQGRKKLSIHFRRVAALHNVINDRIRKCNTEVSPSGILQMVKNFDPVLRERENIMGGASYGMAEHFDSAFRYEPLDFRALGVAAMPELPGPEEAAPAIEAFCKRAYARDKERIAALVAGLG